MTTPSAGQPSPERVIELGSRLAAIRARIDAACAAADRPAGCVQLLAVTKTRPASDVAALIDLGLDAFGENRVQDVGPKADELSGLRPAARPRWHFIGGLQRNKAKTVVRWAERVESVDSERLVEALDTAVRRALDTGERAAPLPVLLQYSVDGDPARGGVPRVALLSLAEHVSGCAGLRLDGLMAVAPLAGTAAEEAFADIAGAAAELRAEHPSARILSAGMSGDMEIAIGYGSDVVRVGTALVGERRIASR